MNPYTPRWPETARVRLSGAQAQADSDPLTRIAARPAPLAASQIRTDRSAPALAGQVRSGAIATPSSEPVCPVRKARSAPLAASQTRTDPSPPALASQVPSGAIATPCTGSVCQVGE